MSLFPNTPNTIFDALANGSAQEELQWKRFDEMYRPVVRQFIIQNGCAMAEIDDVVQDVFVRLVSVLREGRYDRSKARFRTFLAAIVKRLLIDRYRRDAVRGAALERYRCEVESAEPEGSAAAAVERQLELQWREACCQAALRQVLNHSSISAEHRKIYLESRVEGASKTGIAARHNMTDAAVRQICSRIGRRIAACVRILNEGRID